MNIMEEIKRVYRLSDDANDLIIYASKKLGMKRSSVVDALIRRYTIYMVDDLLKKINDSYGDDVK